MAGQIVAKPLLRFWWKATCPYKARGTWNYYKITERRNSDGVDDLGPYKVVYSNSYGLTSKSAIKRSKRGARLEQYLQDRPVKKKRKQKADTVRINHEL